MLELADNLTRATAYNRLQRARGELRRAQTEFDASVLEALKAGFTTRQVGQASGLTHSAIVRRSRRAKPTTPRGGQQCS